MAFNEKRRRVRNESMALDVFHIVVGILVVILAIISFLNPDDHMLLFPVIFLLASALNLATGYHKLKHCQRDSHKKLKAALQILFGIILFLLAAVSAVSIWWR